MHIAGNTALKIIYWNTVFALTIVLLGISFHIRQTHRYDDLIIRVGKRADVPPRLVAALIWTESRFDPTQVGAAGEVGLMQISEMAGREWAEAAGAADFKREDLFDPRINIRAGTWYLAKAISRWSHYPDPLPPALATYNAGYTNARRWADEAEQNAALSYVNAIGYPGVRRYVRNILLRYRGKV